MSEPLPVDDKDTIAMLRARLEAAEAQIRELERDDPELLTDEELETFRRADGERISLLRQLKLHAENASLRAQLAEAVSSCDAWSVKALDAEADMMAVTAERDTWRSKFELSEACSNRLRDRAEIAETERDQWKAEALANLGAEQAADELRKKAETERDKALARMEAYRATCVDYQARAQAAEAGICMPGCETLVATETERDAMEDIARVNALEAVTNLARAEAAENAAGVMRQALEVILIGTRKNRQNCGNCNSTFVEAEDALSHPEAQGGRVRQLEEIARLAKEVTGHDTGIECADGCRHWEQLSAALAALDATGKEVKG